MVQQSNYNISIVLKNRQTMDLCDFVSYCADLYTFRNLRCDFFIVYRMMCNTYYTRVCLMHERKKNGIWIKDLFQGDYGPNVDVPTKCQKSMELKSYAK